jgi:regulator of cell morphogenesis and NO signaling
MTMVDGSHTLADLVTANPGSARVFDRFGLDYSCDGQRTLNDACTTLGIDPGTVTHAVAALGRGASPRWAHLGPTDLVAHLEVAHHRYLWAELPRLTAVAEQAIGAHGERHPELAEVGRALAELRTELETHLRTEERVLFPMIRDLDDPIIAPAIDREAMRTAMSVLFADHDLVSDLLAELREMTGGYVPCADASASYRALCKGLAAVEADTHLHVHKENNVLFPAVMRAEPAVEAR